MGNKKSRTRQGRKESRQGVSLTFTRGSYVAVTLKQEVKERTEWAVNLSGTPVQAQRAAGQRATHGTGV